MEDLGTGSQVSLCAECARHPSLKSIIDKDCVKGTCAVCGKRDVQVRNPKNATPMIMLIRSLIRYYWDEFEYNYHFGGKSVIQLLKMEDNPIIKTPITDEYIDEFGEFIEWPPYPDRHKGVAIYAGHANGMRLINFAISGTDSREVIDLQRRLLKENFFQVEPALDDILSSFISEISCILPRNNIWYRARRGYRARYQRHDLGWEKPNLCQPWLGDEIGAPPPPNVEVGRLNRAGVSMLYLASDSHTAIAEIRPHPGHYVSLGGFRSCECIRLADFDPDIVQFSANDCRLDVYALIQTFDRLMSLPVTPEEKTAYLLTQLLAEVLRKRGFDGVRYRSSVAMGNNICIFYPDRFSFVEGYSEVRRVKSVRYEAPSVPSLIEADRFDTKLD